jgi:hypothetical protein
MSSRNNQDKTKESTSTRTNPNPTHSTNITPPSNPRAQDDVPLNPNQQTSAPRRLSNAKRVVTGNNYDFSGHSDRTEAQLRHDENQAPPVSPTQIPDPL